MIMRTPPDAPMGKSEDTTSRRRSTLRRSIGLFNLDTAVSADPAALPATPIASLKRPHPFGSRGDDSTIRDASNQSDTRWLNGSNSLASTADWTNDTTGATSFESSSNDGSRGIDRIAMGKPTDGPRFRPFRTASPFEASLQPSTKHARGAASSRSGMVSTGHSSSGSAELTSNNGDSAGDHSFQGVKPLQAAFMGTGLMSKRNRIRLNEKNEQQQAQRPPETPCKKPPTANASTVNAADVSSRNASRWLFDPHTSLFSDTSGTESSLRAAEGSMKRFSLTYSSNMDAPQPNQTFEAMSTSTPVPAGRHVSDASTITPSYHGRSAIGGFTSPSPSLRAVPKGQTHTVGTPARIGGSSLQFRALDFALEEEAADRSMTSSELGSPNTPDVAMGEDDHFHLANLSSSMESTSSLRRAPRRPRFHELAATKGLLVSVDERKSSVHSGDQPTAASGASTCSLGDVPCTPVEGNSASESRHSSVGDSVIPAPVRTSEAPFSAPALAARFDTLESRSRSTKSDLFDASLAKKFETVDVLGSGEFSAVYTVTRRADPMKTKLAVKRTKKPLSGPKIRARKLEEVQILRRLNEEYTAEDEGRDYVLQFEDAWENGGHLYIMTEYCENGNLDSFLSEWGNVTRLDEWRVWKILLEIATGLRFIHSQDVLHLDLKPANVFVTFEGTLKIGDFGMATVFPVAEGIEREGDREYIAPEVLSQQQYDRPADIFSLGIMLVEIAANIVLPDNGVHWQKLRSGDLSDAGRLSSGDLTAADGNERELPPPWVPPFMADGSRALDSIVLSMLSPDPRRRPTAADILAKPEIELVESRRQSGAIVYEGDFGPPPTVDGPSWQA